MLNLDGFQPGQLPQPDFQDVFGLPVAQGKTLYQRRLGLIGLPDDGDHLVNVAQHQLPTFQNMDAVQDLVQAVLGAPLHSRLPKRYPFHQYLAQ